MIVFTICSRNFLAQAKVLYLSLTAHHKLVKFYVAVCDSTDGLEHNVLPFSIIRLCDLGIPSLDRMVSTYNITEMNTAIKPFVFDFLFDKYSEEPIVYFDPDILIMGKLTELEQALSDGADCVLTPHLLEPAEFSETDDGKMLRYGIYNLGFCALRGTAQVLRVVRWWGRRLETQCVIDLPQGLFVDQKWADLFPAYIKNTHILYHPGYNVAYWNLQQRTIRNVEGEWLSNGQPLRFFHFSGSLLTEPPVFSRHSALFKFGGLRDLDRLFEYYVTSVREQGLRYFQEKYPYAFKWEGALGKNEHTPASVQKADFGPRYHGNPFQAQVLSPPPRKYGVQWCC